MRTELLARNVPSTRFRTDIQGLRAIAVLGVVLFHAGVPFLPGGYVGVDIFFVISGFLITSHLLTSLRERGKVGFASFYARRARRILPASFVVLALSVIAALIWYPPLLMREVWRGAVATALYVPNYLFAAQGTDYLAETTPSLFQHYWSLGIEEQFYLVWPLFLAHDFLFVRRRSALFALVLAVVVFSFAACVFLTFRSQPWAFFSLPTRGWELGVGGLAAFLLSYRPVPLKGVGASVLGWIGVAGILGSIVLFDAETTFPGFWAAVPVLGTAAVIVAGASRPAGGPGAALSVRPMLFVGLISYSLYLVHWPILQIPQAAVGFDNPLPVWVTLLLGLACVPLAFVMYRFVEEPGRKSSWLGRARPRRTLLLAGAASAAVVLLATGSFAFSNTRPLDAGQAAPEFTISVPPSFTSFVPNNLVPTLRTVAADQPITYDDGCHLDFGDSTAADCVYGDAEAPRIVLFGDSHAAQWFPALLGFAEANGYSVENHTKSACPSISADVNREGIPYPQCTAWRDSVIERINQEQPALVLLANRGAGTLVDPGSDYSLAWGTALTESLERIDAPTAVIADTPNLGQTPAICLSTHLTTSEACGLSRPLALAGATRAAEESAAAELGVPYIDMTSFLCSAQECDPIIDNVLVYRDGHHLTASFSERISPALGDKLASLLAQPASR
ncbi:MAG: acyltransferase family protein [Herbiconiux sp.]|nr:acyltransferase family protein [Herbiconiux sp.]